MGLRINTNVASLAAQNRLGQTSKKLNSALEKLSSGLRINRGADDVVGLLKSESLRSQIRGISAASLNLSNAQSLLGIAEGALSQLTEVAQKLREQVNVAADASVSTADRANLTNSVSDLLNEYSRLAASAEFDGVKLLTGTFTSKTFQVGPNSTDTLTFSISDSRSSAIGKVALLTAITLSTIVVGSTNAFTDPSGVSIEGTSIASSYFTSDGVSNLEGDESAIAWVNAINTVAGTTGVRAEALANTVTLDYGTYTASLSSSQTVKINGVSVGLSSDLAASDADGQTLVNLINGISTQTGVSATIDTTNNKILLSASDGRNIDIYVTGSTLTTTGQLGIQTKSASTVALYRGTFKLYSDDSFTLSGASSWVSSTTSVALDSGTTLSNLSVGSASSATTGLFILDNVIRQIQNRRSDVGSKSIRLDLASSELGVRKENLSAAESVIRDADVASETANLTSAQILQQAGVSVLSRANSIPQLALSLLQQ